MFIYNIDPRLATDHPSVARSEQRQKNELIFLQLFFHRIKKGLMQIFAICHMDEANLTFKRYFVHVRAINLQKISKLFCKWRLHSSLKDKG